MTEVSMSRGVTFSGRARSLSVEAVEGHLIAMGDYSSPTFAARLDGLTLPWLNWDDGADLVGITWCWLGGGGATLHPPASYPSEPPAAGLVVP